MLYTDGLIEHRPHSLAEGLAPVIATLTAITAAQPSSRSPTCSARLHPANPDDDTCILAARPAAETHPPSPPR